MNYIIRILVFIVSLCLLSFLGLFLFSGIYYWFPQNSGSSWMGGDDQWARLFGLSLSSYFFLSLLIVLFFYKYRYYILPIVIILLLPILWMFYPDWSFNGILIGISIAGWLIGEGIVRLYKMIKK